MKTILRITAFALRHFLVVSFGILAGCALWILAYGALVVMAIVSNQPLGGPLALPAGLVLLLISGVVLGWGIFAPASGTGVLFCALFRLPRLVAIPVVFFTGYLLCYLWCVLYLEHVTTHPPPSGKVVLVNYTLFLSLPLGIYWWLTEGPGALWDAFKRWRQFRTFSKPRGQ